MRSPESASVERIAVVRALGGLGDMLCAVPALRALRSARPEAHVTLIALPACRWLLDRFSHLVDALIPFPGFPGIPERAHSPARSARFLERVRRRPFDLALQMHGSGVTSNAFVASLGAQAMAGFYPRGAEPPASRFFFPYPDRGSEVHRCLYLTTSLGMAHRYDRIAFPVTSDDRRDVAAHPALGALGAGAYVCIHPGARDAVRRWPADRFARVADALAGQGYRIVLTGTSRERPTADAVAARMRQRPLNAVGRTSLGMAAALAERAALVVTNDTGMSHLAAALGTPSVVVFLASDPERWAPLDAGLHRRVVAEGGVAGGAAPRPTRPAPSPDPAVVLEQAAALLELRAAEAPGAAA